MKTKHQDLLPKKTKRGSVKLPGDQTRQTPSAVSRNLDEFNQRFFKHPEVKKALKRMELEAGKAAKKPSRRLQKKIDPKAPKLLRQAIAKDERIGELTQATANMMKYHRELNTLLEERANGKERNPKKDRAFAKKWSGIEKDYQTMIKDVCAVYRENPLLMASGQALAENPDDLPVFANPAFLGKDEMAVAKYLGLTSDEINKHFEYSYLPDKDIVATALASGQLEDALKYTEAVADQLPFRLSPEYLTQENVLTVGGDLFLLGLSLFATAVAVITTIVVVAAVVAVAVTVVAALIAPSGILAAAVAQAASSIVQTVESVVEDVDVGVNAAGGSTGGKLDIPSDVRKWRLKGRPSRAEKIRQQLALLFPQAKGEQLPKPLCKKCTGVIGLADVSNSELFVKIAPREKGETGDKVIITVVARDEKGCCVPSLGQALQIGAQLEFVDPYFIPLDWSGNNGVYTAEWGPGNWSGGSRWLKARFSIYNKPGNQVEISIRPNGTYAASQTGLYWQSTTLTRAPEETVELFGYALGNMSRTKMELHTPNCSFLHLVSPGHLQRFDTLQEGLSAGLDNCAYCIGDSRR